MNTTLPESELGRSCLCLENAHSAPFNMQFWAVVQSTATCLVLCCHNISCFDILLSCLYVRHIPDYALTNDTQRQSASTGTAKYKQKTYCYDLHTHAVYTHHTVVGSLRKSLEHMKQLLESRQTNAQANAHNVSILNPHRRANCLQLLNMGIRRR